MTPSTSSISLCNSPEPVYIYNSGVSNLYFCCKTEKSDINIINGGVVSIYNCYNNATTTTPTPVVNFGYNVKPKIVLVSLALLTFQFLLRIV